MKKPITIGRASSAVALDPDAVIGALAEGGLPERSAEALREGVIRVARHLSEAEGPRQAPASSSESGAARQEPASSGAPGVWFVPGRIELLGKHTDYAGGRSLLVAIDQGFVVAAVPTREREVQVVDADGGRVYSRPLSEDSRTPPYAEGEATQGAGPPGSGARGWEIYPETVLRRVLRDFPGIEGGARVAFTSSLPQAAGLSSSSALVSALFLAFTGGFGLRDHLKYRAIFGQRPGEGDRPPRERLATYLSAIEAGRPFAPLDDASPRGEAETPAGVGTEGGSEDHVAMLCCRAEHASTYRFIPTVFEEDIRIPTRWTLVVATSGVRAEKSGAARDAYNRLAREVGELTRIWREGTGGAEVHLGAVLARGEGSADRLAALVREAGEDHLLPRLRQFREECERLIPVAAEAFRASDPDGLGVAVARSQALAEAALGNQIPETIHLVESARRLGALAASAFGAGFGGAVWALVDRDSANPFLERWRVEYGIRFPAQEAGSTFFRVEAGPAAFRIG